MNLKCLLVDDEPPALKVLTTYLENMDNLELVGTCTNAFEAMQMLKDHPVDVLFLDIKMPRLLGTEFVRAVNKLTTGNDQPAGEHVGAGTREPFLYFRIDRKMVKVELKDIRYIESLKDYSRIVRIEDKPLIVKKPISSIEQQLPAPRFLRIHRSFIVAIDKITAFTQNDIEIGDQEIPIGKLYRHQLSKLKSA